MSEPEWGIKRVCPSCSIKYYDFNKSPIICPKCEFEFDPDLLLKSRKGRSIAARVSMLTPGIAPKSIPPSTPKIKIPIVNGSPKSVAEPAKKFSIIANHQNI